MTRRVRFWGATAMRMLCRVVLCSLAHASARSEDFLGASHMLEYESEPLKCHDQTPTNPVARLQRRLDAGEMNLEFDEPFGYLPALLDELKIPRSSQTLPPIAPQQSPFGLSALAQGEAGALKKGIGRDEFARGQPCGGSEEDIHHPKNNFAAELSHAPRSHLKIGEQPVRIFRGGATHKADDLLQLVAAEAIQKEIRDYQIVGCI